MPARLSQWWIQQRSSTRLAYILQMVTRVATALLGLAWTPLLIGAMGKALYGTFLSFQSVTTFGGLGDLGMGGAIYIETSRLLGQRDELTLQKFLAAARAAFLVLGAATALFFCASAPWLPEWLGFQYFPGTGSMSLLFIVGGIGAALFIISNYINNVNYGALNLTWPIIPAFVLLHAASLFHWILARAGAPLWIQYLPYVGVTGAGVALGWAFIRKSHPELSAVFPIAFDWPKLREILAKSFWVYLYCIGGTIYTVTDRLMINAGFGPAQVPRYQLNSKLCELAMFVILGASLVSMPKIGTWIASPDVETRGRGAREAERLSRFQIFLGCAAVLIYVAINDAFMRLWLGRDYNVPLSWQAAFAANMGLTAAGYAGYALAAPCGSEGLRLGALAVAAGSVVKVGLSYWGMVQGSILLIAWSTVVSQSIVLLVPGWFAFKYVGASWWRLAAVGCVLSLAFVGFAAFWKVSPWTSGLAGSIVFVIAVIVLLLITARLLGISARDLQSERAAILSIFGK